jgi:hypothetical protein
MTQDQIACQIRDLMTKAHENDLDVVQIKLPQEMYAAYAIDGAVPVINWKTESGRIPIDPTSEEAMLVVGEQGDFMTRTFLQ